MNKMTLEEAITHAEEIANDNNTCEECKEQHKQLVEWLKELKDLRSKI